VCDEKGWPYFYSVVVSVNRCTTEELRVLSCALISLTKNLLQK
jgi:hypothetical protein